MGTAAGAVHAIFSAEAVCNVVVGPGGFSSFRFGVGDETPSGLLSIAY